MCKVIGEGVLRWNYVRILRDYPMEVVRRYFKGILREGVVDV